MGFELLAVITVNFFLLKNYYAWTADQQSILGGFF